MQSQNKMFAHYQVLEKIGQGGMGAVYKVFDTKLQRIVALKVMIQNPNDKIQSQRFVDEIKAIATLNHDNIVRLFDAGTYPAYYFTMEYIEGKTLDQIAQNLTVKEVVEIFQKVANALYHAHCKGFIHRDVKPGNIIISENLEPKVTDFGLAKNIRIDQSLSQTGEIIGTPKYVSPEQVLTGNIDKRSDIFSLGVTMYEVFAKKYPFSHENQNICATLLYKIVHQEPQALSLANKEIHTNLSTICHTCLHKDPKKRYPNMKVLSRDLERYLAGEPIKATEDTLFTALLPFIFKNKMSCILTLLLIALSITFAITPQTQTPKNESFIKEISQIEMPIAKLNLVLGSYEEKKDSPAFEKANLCYLESLLRNYSADKVAKIYQEKQFDPELAEEAFYQEAYMYIVNGDFGNGLWEKKKIQDIYLRAEKKMGKANLVDSDLMTFYQIWAYAGTKRLYPDRNIPFVPANNAFGYWFRSIVEDDGWDKEKNLLKAIALQKEVRFFNDLALLYDQYDLPEEQLAISLYGLKYFPSAVLLHYFAARAYICFKEYEKAQQHLDIIIKYYHGSAKYRAYYEQIRIAIMTGKIKNAREALKMANSCILENEHLEIEFYKIWQEVIDAYEKGSYSTSVEDTPINCRYRIRVLKEMNMFSFMHSEIEKLNQNDKDSLSKDILLAYIAELNYLDFATIDQYVVNLWRKIYREIQSKLANQSQKNLSVFWYRKLMYLIFNATDCEAIKPYSVSLESREKFDIYLPEDAKEYYFYHKSVADLMYSKLNFNAAALFYDKAFSLAPWFSELENWRDFSIAKYMFYEKNEGDKACNISEKIVQREPPFYPPCVLLGTYYTLRSKNLPKAHAFFSKAENHFFCKIRDRKDIEHDYGTLMMIEGKHQDAIEKFSRYIRLSPSHPFGYSNRGALYQTLGLYDKALDDFSQTILLDENSKNPNKKIDVVRSYQKRAFLHEKWGDTIDDPEEKHLHYQKALEDWITCVPAKNLIQEKENSITRLQEKLK